MSISSVQSPFDSVCCLHPQSVVFHAIRWRARNIPLLPSRAKYLSQWEECKSALAAREA
jgi:hypothetical protein